MQKIIEWKNLDWIKGIAYHSTAMIGGLFSRMTGTNPFEQIGLLVPSVQPASITPTTTTMLMTNVVASAVNYVYTHSNTKLYQILAASPYTQVDKTSLITVSGNILGAIIWNGKYVYGQAGSGHIRAVTLPAGGDDVEVLAGFAATVSDYLPFCRGADSNLYFGYSQGLVGKLVIATGTTGNTNQALQIDFTQTVRDLVNDGRYLVVISDSNAVNTVDRVTGNFKCQVSFWDMFKATCDYVYEVEDSYFVGAKIIDGVIHVIGKNGIYVTAAGSAPKLVRPFSDTNSNLGAVPQTPAQIGVHNGSIYWLNGTANSNIGNIVSAYGNPLTGQQKIFYQPYTDTGSPSSTQKTCMAFVGEQLWVADTTPKIWVHNVAGGTKGTAQVSSLLLTMDRPYTYGYTKVVLDKPLVSGQSVAVTITSQSQGATITNETKAFSDASVGAKQTLIFSRKPSTNYLAQFEDIFITVTCAGATLKRVVTYAQPLPDGTQQL